MLSGLEKESAALAAEVSKSFLPKVLKHDQEIRIGDVHVDGTLHQLQPHDSGSKTPPETLPRLLRVSA